MRLGLGLFLLLALQSFPPEKPSSSFPAESVLDYSGPYSGAVALYRFDDAGDLGKDSLGLNDLTPVNTPTTRPGAIGAAVKMIPADWVESVSSIFDMGTGVSWAMVTWVRVDATGADAHLGGTRRGAIGSGEYSLYINPGTGAASCSMYQAGVKTATLPGVISVGNTYMIACAFNATTDQIIVEVDTVRSGPTATGGDGGATSFSYSMGCDETGTTCGSVTFDTTVYYQSLSGGDVYPAAVATSLYNSGAGKPCWQLTPTELTNAYACWDFDDDDSAGPYIDQIDGSTGKRLNASGSPVSDLGWIKPKVDSGLSGESTRATGNYFTSSSSDFDFAPGSFTCIGWVNAKALNASAYLMGRLSGTTSGSYYIEATSADNQYRASIYTGTGLVQATASSAAYVTPRWTMVGIIVDADAETINMAWDQNYGTPVSWAGQTWSSLPVANFQLHTAASSASNWDGVIDQWACWPRALNANEYANFYWTQRNAIPAEP